MTERLFEQPILNSPYECPSRHWELDEHGQPTQRIVDERRRAELITPIPKPKKQKGKWDTQASLLTCAGDGTDRRRSMEPTRGPISCNHCQDPVGTL